MPSRTPALAAVFSVAVAFPVAAAPAEPVPVTADAISGCPNPTSIAPVESYRYAIDDSRTLAFIAYVEALPAASHADIVKRALRPLPGVVAAALDAAVSDACGTSAVSFRLTRFVYDVASRWTDDDALNMQGAARSAIAALSLGERLGAETRDAALAPFGTSTADFDALASHALAVPTAPDGLGAPGSDCEAGPISATAPAPTLPRYPRAAIDARAEGRVQVAVGLDAHGFVRFVKLYKRDVPQNAGGDALVDASLEAAGSSTYVPSFVHCRSTAGTYVFRAEFSGRS